MPNLTVFIPVYNASPWIQESIESVLAQTYRDFELLVIDDGSTDDTADKVRAIQDSRIRLELNGTNRGIAATRNRALELTSSTWLACLDADDLAVPRRLEIQMAYLTKHPNTVVLGGLGDYFGDMVGRANYPVGADAVRNRLPFDNPFMQNTVVLNATWLKERGIRYNAEAQYCEDFDLWAQVAESGGLMLNLPEVLVQYRIHAASTSRSKRQLQEQMANRIRRRLLSSLSVDLADAELDFLDTYQFEGPYLSTKATRRVVRTLAKKLRAPGKVEPFEIGRFICSAFPRPRHLGHKALLVLSLLSCLPYEGSIFVTNYLAGKG